MTSISALLPPKAPHKTTGCDIAASPDWTAYWVAVADEFGTIKRYPLDENTVARLTVESVFPHRPLRPFEPNRFSKSRGRN
ncbi:hypothetical protein [Agrobacterium radiobacter]|uniref:hypothetical protein n=1 Tax=Agrobacterium radiobacter TaxID=362 RepID=UPI003F86D29C